MSIENPDTRPGHLFAAEGIDRATEYAHGFCANQEAYLGASNQPEIQVLKVRGSLLHDERHLLRERLAEHERDRSHHSGHSRVWNLTIAILFTIGAFFFAVIAFDPFQLSWKAYMYCIGFAVFGLFAVDHFLRHWPNPKVLKAASVVLLSTALPAILALAIVRADVLAHSLKADSQVIIDDTTEQAPPDDDVQHTILFLRIAMVLAALGFELAAGL